jgi:hypothetical protein
MPESYLFADNRSKLSKEYTNKLTDLYYERKSIIQHINLNETNINDFKIHYKNYFTNIISMNRNGHYKNNEYLIFKNYLYKNKSHSMMKTDFNFILNYLESKKLILSDNYNIVLLQIERIQNLILFVEENDKKEITKGGSVNKTLTTKKYLISTAILFKIPHVKKTKSQLYNDIKKINLNILSFKCLKIYCYIFKIPKYSNIKTKQSLLKYIRKH